MERASPTERHRGPGLEYCPAGMTGSLEENLQRVCKRLPIQLARVGEHAALVVLYGPHGSCNTHGKEQKNVTALMDWIADLRLVLEELETFAHPYVFDFPHERMRDVEGMLGIIAEEHSIETARACLRSAGVETVGELNALTWWAVHQACERVLNPDTVFADDTAATPAKFNGPSAAEPAKMLRRDDVINALIMLRKRRGDAAVERLIGVKQVKGAALNTAQILSTGNKSKWAQLHKDALALVEATIITEDDD